MAVNEKTGDMALDADEEIVFCWETGGKAPRRTWTVRANATGLRPLYPESEYE